MTGSWPTNWDGYTGVIPRDCATLPEILRNYGYATSAYGKWHNTPTMETTTAGPFDDWPTAVGLKH
jgi:arylsulfatase A-like enzyme